MPEQKVESGRIANGAVLGNKLAPNSVRANNIAIGQITGNLIGSGAIASNTLGQNLQISLTRVFETANVFSTPIFGNVNIDLQNNTVYFFSSNTSGNVTFNLRANTQNTLDSQMSVGQSVSTAILLKQGNLKYRANLYIDGVLQTLWWSSNSAPSFVYWGQESIDIYSFNVLKTAANTYTVLASNSNFQIALNQNP